MLDIERAPNVDAALQQFIDILPTLRVTAVRRVGVSELVDNDGFGFTRQRRIYVEFLDSNAMIFELANRQDFLPFQQDLSFAPTMRHGETDYDVNALRLQSMRSRQHGVCLTDAGRGAQEYAQLSALFLIRERQQRVGIRPSIEFFLRLRHTDRSQISFNFLPP